MKLSHVQNSMKFSPFRNTVLCW